MGEYMTPDVNGDINQHWGTWLTVPQDATDQVRSGTKSVKWVSVAAGSGIISSMFIMNGLATRVTGVFWLRAARAQDAHIYMLHQNATGAQFAKSVAVVLLANTWQKFTYLDVTPQRDAPEGGLSYNRVGLLVYTYGSVAGDEYWLDDTSLTDDTSNIALKTWNGTAWVPRRIRRF